MNSETHRFGCHNRPPFVERVELTGGGSIANYTAGKPCEYTKSDLGRTDKACAGCKHRSTKGAA